MTPQAPLWTARRLQCLDGTGTYVRLTAAAFAVRQCECDVATRPAAAGRLSGKSNPNMRNCLRIDYAEIPNNHAEITHRLCSHYPNITQTLRSYYTVITQRLRRHYAFITQRLRSSITQLAPEAGHSRSRRRGRAGSCGRPGARAGGEDGPAAVAGASGEDGRAAPRDVAVTGAGGAGSWPRPAPAAGTGTLPAGQFCMPAVKEAN